MKQYRVFIVEDDEDDFDFLEEAFLELGHILEIQHYHSADSLLKTLSGLSSDRYPDLVVLDHQTPGSNGSDAVHQIRGNKNFDELTLVIYSSSIPLSLQEKLLKQGVDLCTTKGNTAQNILNHVETFIELVKKKQEAGRE